MQYNSSERQKKGHSFGKIKSDLWFAGKPSDVPPNFGSRYIQHHDRKDGDMVLHGYGRLFSTFGLGLCVLEGSEISFPPRHFSDH